MADATGVEDPTGSGVGGDPEGPRPPSGHGTGPIEEESFRRFVRRCAPRLVGLGFGLTGDEAEAHDLAQETLARAWERWEAVSGYEDPEAWARRVLRNLAVSRWRRMRRAASWAPRPANADEVTRAGEQLDLVDALRTLPERQRAALVLHDGLGVPLRQVADELGAPEGTVKSWLHRGRAAVAARLSDTGEG